jgi:hypothetical protein
MSAEELAEIQRGASVMLGTNEKGMIKIQKFPLTRSQRRKLAPMMARKLAAQRRKLMAVIGTVAARKQGVTRKLVQSVG